MDLAIQAFQRKIRPRTREERDADFERVNPGLVEANRKAFARPMPTVTFSTREPPSVVETLWRGHAHLHGPGRAPRRARRVVRAAQPAPSGDAPPPPSHAVADGASPGRPS